MPDLVPVKFSNVKAVGYDPDARELHVEFGSGGVYIYEGVPAEEHARLMVAPSIGSHLHREIKGRFKYRAPEAPPE